MNPTVTHPLDAVRDLLTGAGFEAITAAPPDEDHAVIVVSGDYTFRVYRQNDGLGQTYMCVRARHEHPTRGVLWPLVENTYQPGAVPGVIHHFLRGGPHA